MTEDEEADALIDVLADICIDEYLANLKAKSHQDTTNN